MISGVSAEKEEIARRRASVVEAARRLANHAPDPAVTGTERP
jgi:hypothetical protein